MPGLANPLGLLALASVGVLIALTLLARRRRVTPVASVLLWKRIAAPPVERQRFRPDLLFVLRLLLLLALAGGYVRPYLTGARGQAAAGLAIVLDVSASMQVREPGGRRFDAARRRLDAQVAALPADSPVLLVAAADRPRVALRWTTDRARLVERLATLEPLDTPTALASAVRLALGEAARRPGVRVTVLTDLPPAAGALTAEELAAVDWTAVGRRDDNVAVTALTVTVPPFAEPADVRAEVLVQNFARAPRTVTLDARIDDTPWVRHALALPGRGGRRIALGPPPRAGLLHVRLAGDDALVVDDQAFGWIPSQPALDVLAVTESDAFAGTIRALVATAPRSRLEVVNRAGLSERAGAAASPGMVTVFDRRAAGEDGGAGGVLYVAPPPGNTICPAARTLDDASVVDWDAAHPVLAGLHGLEAVEAARATQLALPDWGTPVLTAASRRAAYPFLVAGESRGRRRACLAAELPAGPLTSDAMPLALLVLGTLRWLAEPIADQPIALATGVPRRVEGIAGATGPGVRLVGDPPVLLAERAGVHRLDRDGEPRLVLANLLDAAESDVGRDGDASWPATAPPAAEDAAAARSDLSWWLYGAAGVLLALEWLVWGLAG